MPGFSAGIPALLPVGFGPEEAGFTGFSGEGEREITIDQSSDSS